MAFTTIARKALLLAIISASTAAAQSTGSGACSTYHAFIARGWNEDYPGRQSALVDVVCSGVSSCDYEDVVYDTLIDYETAVEDGRASGLAQIQAYQQKCPDAKLILTGYSEGANVVGNIIGSGSDGSAAGLGLTSAAGSKGKTPSIFFFLTR